MYQLLLSCVKDYIRAQWQKNTDFVLPSVPQLEDILGQNIPDMNFFLAGAKSVTLSFTTDKNQEFFWNKLLHEYKWIFFWC